MSFLKYVKYALPAVLILVCELPSFAKERVDFDNPRWVRRLQVKTLGDYFPEDLTADSKLSQGAREDILVDVMGLYYYFNDGRDPQWADRLIEKSLSPFIMGLTAAQLLAPVSENPSALPLKSWTLEDLIAYQHVKLLLRYPWFYKRALSWIGEPHLRAVTRAGLVSLLGAIEKGRLQRARLLLSRCENMHL